MHTVGNTTTSSDFDLDVTFAEKGSAIADLMNKCRFRVPMSYGESVSCAFR